jgi:hypothetical protein
VPDWPTKALSLRPEICRADTISAVAQLGPVWVLCHEYRRSKRRCATVRELKEGPSGSAYWSPTPATASRDSSPLRSTRRISARRNTTGQMYARAASNVPASTNENDASTTSSTASDKPGAPQLQVNGANPANIATGTDASSTAQSRSHPGTPTKIRDVPRIQFPCIPFSISVSSKAQARSRRQHALTDIEWPIRWREKARPSLQRTGVLHVSREFGSLEIAGNPPEPIHRAERSAYRHRLATGGLCHQWSVGLDLNGEGMRST